MQMILDKHTPQPVGKGPHKHTRRCLLAMSFICATSITCIIEDPETTQRSANRTSTVYCLFILLYFYETKSQREKEQKTTLIPILYLETVNRIGLKNRILKVFEGVGIVCDVCGVL